MKRVVNPYLTAFFRLFGEHIYISCTLTLLFKVLCSLSYLEDDIIQDFLWVDSCAKLADKVSRLVSPLHFQHTIPRNPL